MSVINLSLSNRLTVTSTNATTTHIHMVTGASISLMPEGI